MTDAERMKLATAADLSQVLSDIYNELGCPHDNEEALVVIAALKAAALRAPEADAEVVAWQWRYVGGREWCTASGGQKIDAETLKRERPIEQRPLYARPSGAEAELKSLVAQAAQLLSNASSGYVSGSRPDCDFDATRDEWIKSATAHIQEPR